MGKKEVLAILFLFFIIGFVSAQPWVQGSSFSEGYEIKIPQLGVVKQDNNFTFNFHVYNISNGVPIDNSSTDCFFHLYSSLGNQSYETEVLHSISNIVNEWEILIEGSNFSNVGEYSYVIQCNSSVLGGFESVGFEVTPSGRASPSPGEGMIFLGSLFVMILFSITFLFISNSFKSEKEHKDHDESVMSKGNPALRFGFLAVSFIIAVIAIFYGRISISEALPGFSGTSSVFDTFHFISLIILLVIIIFVFISIFLQALENWRTQKGKNPNRDPD